VGNVGRHGWRELGDPQSLAIQPGRQEKESETQTKRPRAATKETITMKLTSENLQSLVKKQSEAERREYVAGLLDIYAGDWKHALDDELRALFLPQTYEKLALRADTSINVLKQAADQIACVYSRKTTRTVDGNTEPFEVFADLDMAFDGADKKTFVCQETFVRPLYDETRQLLTVDILTPDSAWALPAPLDPLGLSFLMYQKGDHFVVWTAENYAVYDKDFHLIRDPENPDNLNPFGVIPWVCIHNAYPSDGQVFHEGESEQLRQATMTTGVQKTDLNHIQHLQSFKQLVGIGLDDEEKMQKMADPSSMLTIDNPGASVSVLDMQADLKMHLDSVLQASAVTLNQLGIRPEMTRGTLSAQSGYALTIQLHNLERQWEQRRNLWRLFEQRFYDVARSVWFFFTGDELPAGKVQVDYQPLGPGANLAEEVATYNLAVQGKLISRKRAMETLWNMTADEADAELAQIQAEEVALIGPLLPVVGLDDGDA